MAKMKWPMRNSRRILSLYETEKGDASEKLVEEDLGILIEHDQIHHFLLFGGTSF